ncbi:helix-turn-helix domain-containing protein [Paraburkholderia sp. D1E]|uniref:helix-turn-helix domain-containing protein n=1 Tax=Paraburkholderia sp. D1E TaxID=3461398 RepID=UPI0040456FF1
MEKALTLKEVADLLGVSYSTVYAHKEKLGFFQVGNQWRVWPDMLRERSLADRQEEAHPRTRSVQPPDRKNRYPDFRTLEHERAVKALDERLARKPKGRSAK